MAPRGNVRVSITSDPSDLDRGLRRADGSLDKFGKSGARSLGHLKTAAMGATAALTTGLVYGLKESVDAAVEAEKSQAGLEAALKSAGFSYAAHAKEIDNVIQKTSRLAGLDDEDLADAFTKIVRVTGSVKTAMKDMALVADVARTNNMGVAKAGDLVAKAHAGSFVALKRYIGSVEPVTKAQDALKKSTKNATVEQERAAKQADKNATVQKALDTLQGKVGQNSERYAKTAAGAQERWKNSVENLKEAVGEKLLPALTKVADKASKFVDQMRTGKGAGGEFVKTLKDLYERVKPIVEFFTKHPKYIAVAIGAWGAYKIAAKAAAIYSQQQLIRSFKGQALAAQVAAATAAGGAAGTAYGGKGGMGGKLMTAMGALNWAGLGLLIANQLGIDRWVIKQLKEVAPDFATTQNIAPNPTGSTIGDLITGANKQRPGKTSQGQRGPTGTVGFRRASRGPVASAASAIGFTNTMPGGTASSSGRTAAYNRGIGVTYDALVKAGFRGRDLTNFLAIAARESRYDPHAANYKYPDHSIGLFQINQLAWKGLGYSDQDLMDPYTNARAAAQVFAKQGYAAWNGLNGVTSGQMSRAQRYAGRHGVVASKPRTVSGTSLQAAGIVAKKFGLTVGSGFRTPEHNAAVNGVPGGYHTRGSASNPGAVDLNGPVASLNAASAWAATHVSPLAENMVHDAGSGLHLHLAFASATVKVKLDAGDSSTGATSGRPLTQAEINAGHAQRVSNTLELIGLKEGAGLLTAGQADRRELGVIRSALHGDYGSLSQRDRLGLMGTRREITSGIAERHKAIRRGERQDARTQKKKIREESRKQSHWVYNQYVKKMARIDESEAAGLLSSSAARKFRLALIDQALNNTGFAAGRKPLGPHERRLVLADLQAVRGAQLSDEDEYRQRRNEAMEADRAAAGEVSPDAQAQIDQANLRAAIAQRTAAISGAELSTFQGAGAIGYGGPVIVFKVGESEFARAAVQSLNSQPAVTTSRTAVGV